MTDEQTPTVRWTLWCGMAAGPVLTVLLFAQGLWREDYELGADPISSLSLGPYGWVQILNFTVVGVLVGIFGFGVHRLHRAWCTLGRLFRFAGALLIIAGAGLVGVGVFVVDPSAWHGTLHDLATGLAINAALFAITPLAVVWWRAGRRGRAVHGALTALVCAPLGWCPQAATIALRHTIVVVLIAVWLTTTALFPLRDDGRKARRGSGAAGPVM